MLKRILLGIVLIGTGCAVGYRLNEEGRKKKMIQHYENDDTRDKHFETFTDPDTGLIYETQINCLGD